MKSIALKLAIFLMPVFIFSAGVDARPTASVKFSTTRAENPRGVKNSLILPYAFSSDSMGFTLGVGAGFKGYGQDQLLLRQFKKYQSFNTDFGKQDYTVHPLQLGLYYNNTDFVSNPSKGSTQFLAVTRDFGWLESDESWTFVEFEASKYFSLGGSRTNTTWENCSATGSSTLVSDGVP